MSRESETRAANTRSALRLRAATMDELMHWYHDPEALMEIGRRVSADLALLAVEGGEPEIEAAYDRGYKQALDDMRGKLDEV